MGWGALCQEPLWAGQGSTCAVQETQPSLTTPQCGSRGCSHHLSETRMLPREAATRLCFAHGLLQAKGSPWSKEG